MVMMEANAAQKPGVMDKVQARRTLLLGLGTTGACICGQILERLAWAYDKVDHVPWVRSVVLETKDVAAAPEAVRDYSRFVHLKIDKAQYASLINDPQNYEGQFGFNTWNNPDLTGSGDAITDGANNVRMLGRLSLLFPPNYTAATREIRSALAALKALDEKEAGELYSRSLPKPVQVEMGDDLHVYVVGTLAGGTSSGSFIDMGYILQSLDGYQNAIKPTGVFLLPSAEHPNEKHTANAYAALIELNHYSSDHTRYTQQFPDRVEPRQMPPGVRPYPNLYLLQARGEAPIEYAKIVTAAADFIHSDVIGGTAAERDATRTNIQDYFINKDMWGATQKFLTFGTGAIEFPFPKVMKACSLRLARVGFQMVAGGDALTGAVLQNQMSGLPLLPLEALMSRLLQRSGKRIEDSLSRVLQDAYAPAQHANDPLDLARAQAEAAFQGTAQSDMHPELPPNIVPLTIEENKRAAAGEFRAAIEKTARVYLAPNASGGLTALVSYLEGLHKALDAAKKEADGAQQSDALAAMLSQADEAQEQARACRTDLPLRLAWGKSAAVKRYVQNCLQSCQSYYTLRLRSACAPICAEIYAANRKYVETLLLRVQNSSCGLLKDVRNIVDGMNELYNRTNVAYGTRFDGTVRVINGVELFDPDKTVSEEYAYCLRTTIETRGLNGDGPALERLLGLQAVQAYVEAALPALFAEANIVRRFDPEGSKTGPLYDDYQLVELARPARATFHPLNTRSIIARLLERAELAADLKKANDASGLMLNWEAGLPRHRDAENKAYKFFFYNDKDPQAKTFRETVEKSNILGTRDKMAFINDQHMVMLLQERGAFSLGTIRELQDGADSKWRSDFANPTIASFHSRKDITEWTTWARSDEEARSHSRSIFLVGAALEVIRMVSPQQYVFTYPPRRASDAGQLLLSSDLDLAAQRIKGAGLQADIEQRIALDRRTNGAPDLISRFVAFIQGSEGKFQERERKLSVEQVEAYIFDYVERDMELLERWQMKFPDTKELRLLARDEQGNVARDGEGRPTYRCACSRREVLGHKASDLYVLTRKDSRLVPVFKCAVCSKSLEYDVNIAP